MGSEKQLAEMPCPRCGGTRMVGEEHENPEQCTINLCSSCQGTGLRWPGLSRECASESHSPCTKEVECYSVSVFEYILTEDCHGSRIPDVTLEKVLGLLAERGSFTLQYYKGAPTLEIAPHWGIKCIEDETGNDEWPPLRGQPTPLDAACAALLAS